MVIVQITIEDHSEKGLLEMSCYLLKREDATVKEFALAQVLESKYKDFIDRLSKATKAEVTTEEIKGK